MTVFSSQLIRSLSQPQAALFSLLLLIFATLTSILAFACPAQALEMVIAYENKAQPPYYMGDSNAPLATNPGVSVEMVQMLEQRIPDLKIRLIRFPWKRCLETLQLGEVDGIFNSSFAKDRAVIGRYPMKNGQVDLDRRLTTISYNFYRMPDSSVRWDGQTISGLQGAVGAPLGYSIVKDLKGMGVEVDEAPSTKLVLDKLLRKRNSVAALQAVTADALRNSNHTFQDIIKIDPPLRIKAYYLMISHQFAERNPQLAERIWDEIATMRDEDFSRLLSKYLEDSP